MDFNFIKSTSWQCGDIIMVEIILKVTTRCNRDCLYCFAKEKFSDPSLKLIQDSILEVKKKHLSKMNKIKYVLNFSGGEPLLRRDIYQIIKYAKSVLGNDVRIQIQTNATELINHTNLLSDFDNIVFFVGVPSINPINYKILVNRKNKIKNVFNSLDLLYKYKKEVCFNFILNKINYNEVEKAIELISMKWPNFNINFSTLSPGTPYNFYKKYGLSYSKAARIIEKSFSMSEKMGLKMTNFGGDCYPLICFFNNKKIIDSFNFNNCNDKINYVDEKFTKFVSKHRYKHISCKSCRYDSKCQGLFEAYVKLYSIREINK